MEVESTKCVCVSGYLMSSLLYEHNSNDSDQEGFLVGDVVVRHTETISDNQMSFKKEETIVNIYSHVPCEDVYSFYTFGGSIKKEKLDFYLKDKQKDVVGWYHFRRHTPLVMSVREKAVHKSLAALLPHGEKIAFGLFSSFSSDNIATHTFDHMFYMYSMIPSEDEEEEDVGDFETVALNIVNLEDSAHDEYRLYPRAPVNTKSGLYCDIVKPSQSSHSQTLGCRGFSRAQEQLPESVLLSEDINTALLDKIEGLIEQVGGSEAEIGCITFDIKELEEKIASELCKGLPGMVQTPGHSENVSESRALSLQVEAENYQSTSKTESISINSSTSKCDDKTVNFPAKCDDSVGCARTRSFSPLKTEVDHEKDSKSDSC